MIAVVGEPIAAQHLDNPSLQQTLGRAHLVAFGSGGSPERALEGSALATVVGKKPSGELLANHHLLFAAGSLRTQNDVVPLQPTADKCVFTSKVTVNRPRRHGRVRRHVGHGYRGRHAELLRRRRSRRRFSARRRYGQ